MATEQPRVKLYWLDGSRAQNIVWLLEELNVKYEVEIFHRDAKMQAPEALRKAHPLGKSPVIEVLPPSGSAATVAPDAKKHLGMLEHFLETSPEGGSYICGQFSAVDILLSFALILGEEVFDSIATDGSTVRDSYPLVYKYIGRLKEEPGYQRSFEKMKLLNGGV